MTSQEMNKWEGDTGGAAARDSNARGEPPFAKTHREMLLHVQHANQQETRAETQISEGWLRRWKQVGCIRIK